MSADTNPKPPENLIRRGVKTSNPLGTSLFLGLRSLDPFLQHALLSTPSPTASLFQRVGLQTIPSPPLTTLSLGLSPYRLVLLSTAVGSALKQNFWLLFTAQEEKPPQTAVIISVFSTICNSLNTLLFTCTLTFRGFRQRRADHRCRIPLAATAGGQYHRFKADAANKGQVYTGGLFGYARHINYGAYTLWRAGFAVVAGWWWWGAVVGGFCFYDFAAKGVPELDQYCQGRYATAWTEFKQKVPYQLFPELY